MAADKQTIFLVDTLTVDVAGTTLGALIPLGGPSHDAFRSYLLSSDGGTLLEVQCIRREEPHSWFVDQRVHSDGAIHVTTRVDPAFLLLPILSANTSKANSLAQLLHQHPHLRHLKGVSDAAAALCDISGAGLDGEPMLRLNRSKTLEYLGRKCAKLASLLKEKHASLQSRTARETAFVARSTSVLSASLSSTSAPQPTRDSELTVKQSQHLAAAIDIVSDYIGPTWTSELVHHVGYNQVNDATTCVSAETKALTKAEQWNAAALDDAATTVSKYVRGGGGGHTAGADAIPAKKPALTLAQRQLANTNITGMKTMASFFAKRSDDAPPP